MPTKALYISPIPVALNRKPHYHDSLLRSPPQSLPWKSPTFKLTPHSFYCHLYALLVRMDLQHQQISQKDLSTPTAARSTWRPVIRQPPLFRPRASFLLRWPGPNLRTHIQAPSRQQARHRGHLTFRGSPSAQRPRCHLCKP